MSFHQQKQFWYRNIIVSTQLISVGKCQYRMPQRNHLRQLLELLLPGVWGKHPIIEVFSKLEKKWWQTTSSYKWTTSFFQILKKPQIYGERIWKRHPNSQYLTNHPKLSTQHAVPTKQHSNKKRLEYENVSIKTGRIPCFKSHVWSQTKPRQPKPPKQDLDLLQDDVCQSGSCLGILTLLHLRSCSSYSTHVCRLS